MYLDGCKTGIKKWRWGKMLRLYIKLRENAKERQKERAE